MLIYLLRHGDAPFESSCGERSLSSQGELETRQVVEQHLDSLLKLQLIVCSPVLRARQTLQVLTDTLSCSGGNYSGELLFEDVLRSEGSVAGVERYVDALVDSFNTDQILLLSHQPLIGHMLEYLTDNTGSGLGWSMGTSSLAVLDATTFGRGCAELKELVQP